MDNVSRFNQHSSSSQIGKSFVFSVKNLVEIVEMKTNPPLKLDQVVKSQCSKKVNHVKYIQIRIDESFLKVYSVLCVLVL